MTSNFLNPGPSIRSILRRETSVIDPSDVTILAKVIVDDLPPVFRVAPDMLETLEALMEFWDNGTPVFPGSLVVDDARKLIAKARGGTP